MNYRGEFDLNSKIYRRAINPFALGGLIALFLVLAAISKGMSLDEGMWNYMAWAWVKKGLPPYTGTVDNKPQGVLALYALSTFFFGINTWFPRLIGILAALSNAVIIYKFGSALHDRLSGFFAMLFFGFTLSWSLLDAPYTSHPESIMILFVTLAFYLLLKIREAKTLPAYSARLFAAGFSMGLALCFKQIALFSSLALFLFYLTLRSRYKNILRDTATAGGGALTAILISLTPLFLSGVFLLDYWEGVWLILLLPVNRAASSMRGSMFFKILTSKLALFYPLFFLFIKFRKKISAGGKAPFAGLLIWLILDCLGANASGYYYGHHLKQLVPSFSLAAGVAMAMLLEDRYPEKLEKKLLPAIALTVILWFPYYMFLTYRGVSWPVKLEYPDPEKEMGLWLKKRTAPNDYVYLFCWTNKIQAYAQRLSPSRYLNLTFVDYPAARREIISDLKARPPKFIVHDKKYPIPKELTEICEESYRPVSHQHSHIFYKLID